MEYAAPTELLFFLAWVLQRCRAYGADKMPVLQFFA